MLISERKPILAVDGGGSGFRKALVRGTEISDLTEATGIETVSQLLDFVNQDLPDVQGISYAIAGVIGNYDVFVKSPNIPFLNKVFLGSKTTERTGKPAIVCNDMEAAVTGMAQFFPQLKYFMGITWSSGIGVRIFKNGKILSESEAGHMNIDCSSDAPLCGCGLRGCAEAILGGYNLKTTVICKKNESGEEIPNDCKNPNAYLHLCFDGGEEWAIEIYNDLCTGMARFLANVQSLLHLPAIVWKGMLGKQVLSRIEYSIRMNMRKMLINPDWENDMKSYYVWGLGKCKDADSLIGAAEISRASFPYISKQ
jgi:predicted NBD/HSP70 family sugar kinase